MRPSNRSPGPEKRRNGDLGVGYSRAHRERSRLVATGVDAILWTLARYLLGADTVVDTLPSKVARDVLNGTYRDVQTVVSGHEQTLPEEQVELRLEERRYRFVDSIR